MRMVMIRLSTVALVIAVGACRKSLVVQTPPHPSGWASSTTVRPNPPRPVPATFSGSLPEPLSKITGKALYDFIATMPRGHGMDAERKCKGVGCFFSGGSVKVGIESAADAMYLSDNNADAKGTIGAIVVNKGKYKTERYEFAPDNGSVHHTYAFIVFPKGIVGVAKYVLEDIVKDGSTFSHSTVLTGTFVLCHHDVWWNESQAAFQTCAKKMSKGRAGTGIVTMGFDLLAVPKSLLTVAKASAGIYAYDDTPGWISCSAGCCTFGSADGN